jgi:hypothetical protein
MLKLCILLPRVSFVSCGSHNEQRHFLREHNRFVVVFLVRYELNFYTLFRGYWFGNREYVSENGPNIGARLLA